MPVVTFSSGDEADTVERMMLIIQVRAYFPTINYFLIRCFLGRGDMGVKLY